MVVSYFGIDVGLFEVPVGLLGECYWIYIALRSGLTVVLLWNCCDIALVLLWYCRGTDTQNGKTEKNNSQFRVSIMQLMTPA